jgi:hypothetical protein
MIITSISSISKGWHREERMTVIAFAPTGGNTPVPMNANAQETVH